MFKDSPLHFYLFCLRRQMVLLPMTEKQVSTETIAHAPSVTDVKWVESQPDDARIILHANFNFTREVWQCATVDSQNNKNKKKYYLLKCIFTLCCLEEQQKYRCVPSKVKPQPKINQHLHVYDACSVSLHLRNNNHLRFFKTVRLVLFKPWSPHLIAKVKQWTFFFITVFSIEKKIKTSFSLYIGLVYVFFIFKRFVLAHFVFFSNLLAYWS